MRYTTKNILSRLTALADKKKTTADKLLAIMITRMESESKAAKPKLKAKVISTAASPTVVLKRGRGRPSGWRMSEVLRRKHSTIMKAAYARKREASLQ